MTDIHITYRGGPRGGQTQVKTSRNAKGPHAIGAADDAKAKGMAKGLYRRVGGSGTQSDPAQFAWREV